MREMETRRRCQQERIPKEINKRRRAWVIKWMEKERKSREVVMFQRNEDVRM